jgi:peptide/nickel transport system ATP-binding protein
MAPLLSIEELRVEFSLQNGSVTGVEDMSLAIEPGECVGVVGESGCGKTTTGLAVMRLLASNAAISHGAIHFEGDDLSQFSEKEMRKIRGNRIALIPQDPLTSLNPTTRIGRQIAEGYRIHTGASAAEGEKRAIEVLEMVEMPRPKERLRQYPFELSGGLRQRAIIAMGLVCAPKLLIADEPTTALDVTIQAQILDIFDHLRANLEMAVILITHDMGVIASRTDRVVVMYAGKKAEQAPTATLFKSMQHPYTQALLASVPSLEARARTRLRSIPGLPPDLTGQIVGCRFAPRCVNATDVCSRVDPPLTEAGADAEHIFACHNPIDGPAPLTDLAPVTLRAEISESTEPLLNVVRVVKEFPITKGILRKKVGAVSAVAGVSFQVRDGETFGLVGESGCGKTTLGRLVVGLEKVDAGAIEFNGGDVTAESGAAERQSRRNRQMMFQDPYSSLNPRMIVRELIREPLSVQGVGSRMEQNERVDELLGLVGLDVKAAARHPHEFSGGQRQRIGLARALALNPKLIIADEPVSALDVSIQAQILNLMQDLQARLGTSLVLISHDLAVVHYMADTIGVMYMGKIVEIGNGEDVFRTPAHPYTRGLLDAVPEPDPEAKDQRKYVRVQGELPSASNPPSGCRFRTRCPRAQDICAEQEPTLVDFGPRHQAACFFPLLTPVTIAASPNAGTSQSN